MQSIFPRLLLTNIPRQLLGSNLSPLLWIGVISPWLQILGNMPELRMMLKRLEFVVCLFDNFMYCSMPSTPQAFLGWRVCILSCSSFNVIGEFSGFWLSLIVHSKICSSSCTCFCCLVFVIETKRVEKWFTYIGYAALHVFLGLVFSNFTRSGQILWIIQLH